MQTSVKRLQFTSTSLPSTHNIYGYGLALPLAMNDASLKRRIAQIATDSSRVVVLPHAKKRMRKRNTLLTQILHCLRRGNVVEPAHQDIYGCWKCTLETMSPATLSRSRPPWTRMWPVSWFR